LAFQNVASNAGTNNLAAPKSGEKIMSNPTVKVTLGAAMVMLAAACASTPVPNEKIAVAQASVQRAEQAGASTAAPVEMSTAREKLAQAQKAATDHEVVPATNLADQANVDAQLAEATAVEQRSHKAAMEFDASLQALRQEAIQHSQPAQYQPAQ
jgi:hypothetical protein